MTANDADSIIVRPGRREDLESVAALIHPHVEHGKLLPRTEDELEELLTGGFVALAGERVVGFATLEVYSAKLAEVRSLVVAEDTAGRGVGKQLVAACVERAHERNILEVMAVTSEEEFFRSCGFDFTLPGEKKALFIQTRDS
jgi:amino-acid N-acetyltransferase